jgi:hypothetical protein
MSQVSKNQLIYENSTYFPNNNSGAITPADLRAFNVDVIDSTVNQTLYTADSSSFNSRISDADNQIDNLNAFTQSQEGLNETFATTGSNTFEGSQTINGDLTLNHYLGVEVNLIPTPVSGGLYIDNNVSINGTLTASLENNYVWLGGPNGQVRAVPSSSIAGAGGSNLTSLNAFTASQNTKNATLATYTGSINTKFTTLGTQSGSWITTSQTGSFARTNTTNTFTATQTINADLIVSGTINAYKINTTIESSSVIFSSGSNILGDSSTGDTQTLNGVTSINGNTSITGSTTISGSTTINGSTSIIGNTTITGSTSTTDSITINKSGGNGLVLSNSGISSAGTIITNNNVRIHNQYGGLTVAANQENSGSIYSNVNVIVDMTTDPTNVFSGVGVSEQGTARNITLALNSYAYQYPGITVPSIIGFYNNVDGSDLAMAFPTNGQMDVWKKSNFAYGVDVTGSLKVTGGITGSIRATNGVISGSSQIAALGYATTGSNTFNGSQIITGSLTTSGAGSIKGGLFVTGGNLVVQDNNLTTNRNLTIGIDASIGGTLTANNNIWALNSGVFSAANTNFSGSQYPGFTAIASTAETPTDIYGGFSINNSAGSTLTSFVVNSYTPEYSGTPTAVILGGGNNPDGSNTAIAFTSNGDMDVWKETNFKYGTTITGSVNGNVEPADYEPLLFTASFDFSSANFFDLTIVPNTNIHITATNVKPGQTVNVKVTQGDLATGSVSFDPSFKFPAFAAYTASLQTSAVDILTFITFDDTGSIYSAGVKNFQ